MTPVRQYRDLVAWQKARAFVPHIYRAARGWPKEEKYGFTNQVRRAAVSVPANIAEGHGRGGDREFAHFLRIANGSLFEVETYLLVALDLTYLPSASCDLLSEQTAEIGRLIHGLLRHLRSSIERA